MTKNLQLKIVYTFEKQLINFKNNSPKKFKISSQFRNFLTHSRKFMNFKKVKRFGKKFKYLNFICIFSKKVQKNINKKKT